MSSAKLLDVVALTVDLPRYNLWRGQVGTVVEMLANGTAFEAEFSDRENPDYAPMPEYCRKPRRQSQR